MGFFSSLFNGQEWAQRQNDKHLESAKESYIAIQKKLDPNRSTAAIEAEFESSISGRKKREAREKELSQLDNQYWEDVAAGRVSKDTLPPSKAAFAALSPEEQQAETIRRQQVFQAQQIRAHNSRVESVSKQIQLNKALNISHGNTEFLETELKKLTAQQPVFAPIGAVPVVNVNVGNQAPASSSAMPSMEGDDELWEQAANELETGNRKEGLWAKCFAQAGGDENKAKAIYYEARVKQLSNELANSQSSGIYQEEASTTQLEVSNVSPAPLTELQKALQNESSLDSTQPEAIKEEKIEAATTALQPTSNTNSVSAAASNSFSSSIASNPKSSKRNLIIGALAVIALIASGVVYKNNQVTGIVDLKKLNMDEIKEYSNRFTAYNNASKAHSAQDTTWKQANLASYLQKSPLMITDLTPEQLNDISYASPAERKKLHEYVEFRKVWNKKYEDINKQYQPLWINTNEKDRAMEKFFSRALTNLENLADAKVTYGEYNRIRKQNYERIEIESKEIDQKYPFPF